MSRKFVKVCIVQCITVTYVPVPLLICHDFKVRNVVLIICSEYINVIKIEAWSGEII